LVVPGFGEILASATHMGERQPFDLSTDRRELKNLAGLSDSKVIETKLSQELPR
jgi:hypothetical protein